MSDHSVDHLFDEEGLSLHFVDAHDLLSWEMHLEIIGKHTGVKLGHDDTFVFAESLYGVGGKRIDILELIECHFSAIGIQGFGGSAQMSVSAAPTEKNRVGAIVEEGLHQRDIAGDVCHFETSGVDHLLMVGSIG